MISDNFLTPTYINYDDSNQYNEGVPYESGYSGEYSRTFWR